MSADSRAVHLVGVRRNLAWIIPAALSQVCFGGLIRSVLMVEDETTAWGPMILAVIVIGPLFLAALAAMVTAVMYLRGLFRRIVLSVLALEVVAALVVLVGFRLSWWTP